MIASGKKGYSRVFGELSLNFFILLIVASGTKGYSEVFGEVFVFCFFFFLAAPRGLQDLSVLTRD